MLLQEIKLGVSSLKGPGIVKMGACKSADLKPEFYRCSPNQQLLKYVQGTVISDV